MKTKTQQEHELRELRKIIILGTLIVIMLSILSQG